MHIFANSIVIILAFINSIFGVFNETPVGNNTNSYFVSPASQNDEELWCASSLQPGQDKPVYTGNDCPEQ